MSDAVPSQPADSHTLTPYLAIRDAPAAIDFYKQAFGASENNRLEWGDGSIMHCELQIGDSIFMLGEEMPEMGSSSPATIGDSPVGILIYVEDVDAALERAVQAGAEIEMPPADMFWGDRFAKLKDPFGHKWSLATHIEDVDNEEMARRAAAFAAEMPSD